MYDSKFPIRLIAAIAFVIGAIIIWIGFVSGGRYSDFESKVATINIGDSLNTVKSKMIPYAPTTNNADLKLGPGKECVVYRRYDIVYVFYFSDAMVLGRVEKYKL
jgi:hypothetical protein